MSNIVCLGHLAQTAAAFAQAAKPLREQMGLPTTRAYVMVLDEGDPDSGVKCEHPGCRRLARFRVGPM